MTSNIGSEFIQESLNAQTKSLVMQKVKTIFKPELLNRMDEICIFNALNPDNLSAIIKILLQDIRKRLVPHDIKINMSSAAITSILSKAFDSAYGARPLKRYLDKVLITDIAKLIIKGELLDHSQIGIYQIGEVVRGSKAFNMNDTDLAIVVEDKQGMDMSD
jgi:ATP-dependent Clp protease ATP-binding subunit ClpB